MSEVILNDDNFKSEVKDFQGVVLVDFWATWCPPCQMQGPIVAELAKDQEGKDNIKIAKLDVDQAQATAQRFGVRSIPTLIFFKNGQVAEQLVGLSEKHTLQEKLDTLSQ